MGLVGLTATNSTSFSLFPAWVPRSSRDSAIDSCSWSFYGGNALLFGVNVVATVIYGGTAALLSTSARIRSYVATRDRWLTEP